MTNQMLSFTAINFHCFLFYWIFVVLCHNLCVIYLFLFCIISFWFDFYVFFGLCYVVPSTPWFGGRLGFDGTFFGTMHF